MRFSLNANAALIGGVLGGIGASACCVGPLALLGMGVGGAWIAHLTALEPYRPIFIGLTALFVGLAFWRLYLSPNRCASGEACLNGRNRGVQRLLFWISVPLIIGLIASPWVITIFVH